MTERAELLDRASRYLFRVCDAPLSLLATDMYAIRAADALTEAGERDIAQIVFGGLDLCNPVHYERALTRVDALIVRERQ